ncbi:hypothetical protein QBC35DRAFT_212431 [Podospora australis]|uniref:BTB domain-containing protein n=1 Tax=Podospora australis TaxID=1536484 RepID=A0AAN6WVN7_9PEZI|nr:hypothetical protein QBC35DRAFT_212431 [Podospora australis]
MENSKDHPTCVMDKHGDSFLSAQEDPNSRIQHFQVDSHALRRASPVFDKMLFGGWKETRPRADDSNPSGSSVKVEEVKEEQNVEGC